MPISKLFFPGLAILLIFASSSSAASDGNGVFVEGSPKDVQSLHQGKDALWIGAIGGLYRLRIDEHKPTLIRDFAPNGVLGIYEMDNDLWIGVGRSLVRWRADLSGDPTTVPANTGYCTSIQKAGDFLWFACENGLFRLTIGREAYPQPVGTITGTVNRLYNGGNALWIGSDTGLFFVDPQARGEPQRVPLTFSGGELHGVTPLADLAGTFWLAQRNALFYAPVGSWNAVMYTTELGFVTALVQIQGDEVWIGAERGLFRMSLNQREEEPEQLPFQTGTVHQILDTGQSLWIGSHRGLFRIRRSAKDWPAKIQLISAIPATVLSDYEIPITWKISNFNNQSDPSLVSQRVLIFAGGKGLRPIKTISVNRGAFQANIGPLPEGTYTAVIQATDLFGNTVQSEEIRIPVGQKASLLAQFKAVANWLGLVYGVANVTTFLVLLIGARWSKRCFDILSDPLVRKVSIYYGFALTHITFVRLWVFERYFHELKGEFRDQATSKSGEASDFEYLPAPMYGPRNSRCLTTELEKWLTGHQRVWIKGGPGTGKTEALRALIYEYTRAESLRDAWRRFGFIPIVISIRDFTGGQVPAMAQKALASKKMAFDLGDEGFFGRMLESNGFLIVIDGLNESKAEADAIDYAMTKADVRMLVTSQASPQKGSFTEYLLPAVGGEFAKDLLRLFLGVEKADEIIKVSPQLWGQLESAYDVRLVADLGSKGSAVPTERMGLFDAMLWNLSTLVGNHSLEPVVCRVAWDLWKKAERRFSSGVGLTDEMVGYLLEARIAIARGDQFEFRHDLVRGYLAACWAVRQSPSTAVLVTRLSEKEIWDLSTSDQDTVFPFLVRLVQSVESLQPINRFASEESEVRVRLLVAAIEAARNFGWSLQLAPQ